jgi:signal transduction histidine kinase
MAFARYQSAFVGASVLTVASFLGATAYSQSRLTALDALSSTIASNAVPSIDFLGRGAVRLQRLRRLVHDEVTAGHSRSTLETAAAELDALHGDLERYLRLTPLPGERELWVSIRRDLDRATRDVRSILGAIQRGDPAAATTLLETQAEPSFERATKTMLAAMEFDVSESERLAREVRAVRLATTENIILLDALATAIAAGTVLIAFRAAREHERLQQRHNGLLAERVAELDRFAGRAAHDILSPLNTVGLGLALIARSSDASVQPHVDRSLRALQRVQQLVNGLLEFARSGVQSESDVRSPVDAVLETVAIDCSEAARSSDIQLAVHAEERLEAACSVGILTSLVQNLVLNAIKYMGLRPVRKVTLRAREANGRVRIEVEDTGPGIAAEFQTRIFEPFVRGTHHEDVSGMGLGLATVKRLVDAHGGTVGVQSRIGIGTLFWIELPRAPQALAGVGLESRASQHE